MSKIVIFSGEKGCGKSAAAEKFADDHGGEVCSISSLSFTHECFGLSHLAGAKCEVLIITDYIGTVDEESMVLERAKRKWWYVNRPYENPVVVDAPSVIVLICVPGGKIPHTKGRRITVIDGED